MWSGTDWHICKMVDCVPALGAARNNGLAEQMFPTSAALYMDLGRTKGSSCLWIAYLLERSLELSGVFHGDREEAHLPSS
jgi:hypothetical protein